MIQILTTAGPVVAKVMPVVRPVAIKVAKDAAVNIALVAAARGSFDGARHIFKKTTKRVVEIKTDDEPAVTVTEKLPVHKRVVRRVKKAAHATVRNTKSLARWFGRLMRDHWAFLTTWSLIPVAEAIHPYAGVAYTVALVIFWLLINPAIKVARASVSEMAPERVADVHVSTAPPSIETENVEDASPRERDVTDDAVEALEVELSGEMLRDQPGLIGKRLVEAFVDEPWKILKVREALVAAMDARHVDGPTRIKVLAGFDRQANKINVATVVSAPS